MSIPNGKNVYGYAEAYAKLANFGQQHLLKYYDELDEAQRAALLNQIEQIDFSVVSTNKQPEKRGRITPIGVTELAEIRTRGDEFFDAGMAELRAGHVGAVLLAVILGVALVCFRLLDSRIYDEEEIESRYKAAFLGSLKGGKKS